MLRVMWSLFLTGLFFGFGPCLFSCGPILVSYITGTGKSGRLGLRAYMVFSLTRVIVYSVMGILIGLFGEKVVNDLQNEFFLKAIFLLFGFFLLIIGFIICIEKISLAGRCRNFVSRYADPGSLKNVVIFGFFVAVTPCMPLIAMLGYIALVSDSIFKGVAYMSAFGIGTVISPLLFLSLAAGWAAGILERKKRAVRFARVVSGVIIFVLGVNLIVTGLNF